VTEAEHKAKSLRDVKNMPGWKYVEAEINARIKEGWEEFICLPVDQKTSKAAFQHQARYTENKGILEWIEGAIVEGQ